MAPDAKIPAWQRAASLPGAEDVKATPPPAEEPNNTEPKAQAQESQSEPTHDRGRKEEKTGKDDIDSLKDSAFKFLNDPSIKNAPQERKVAFLESKGLKSEEIDLLLSSQPATAQVAPPRQPSSQPAAQSQPQQPPKDTPPVIAYPEFLVQSEKPPPLVTKTLLLNAAYATAGIYGTLYALSKYIINPMQAQLSEARHDLLTHSTNQMDAFNSKLGTLVSSPVTTSRPGTALKQRDLDEDSEDGDPTELFHRDFGTQTSPNLSRRNSTSSTPSEPSDPITSAESILKRLTIGLKDMNLASETATAKDNTSKELSELVTSLNEMAYTNSGYYKYGAGTNGYGWASGEKAQDDEIERLVKEVKGLKGRFLGVRNFARVGAR